MQVKHDVVRIGDVIALADLEAGGYVVGDDVVGDSLYVEPEDAFMPPLSPHQLDTAQFVVVPRFQYSAHAQLLRLVHSAQIPGMDGAALEQRGASAWRASKSILSRCSLAMTTSTHFRTSCALACAPTTTSARQMKWNSNAPQAGLWPMVT